MFLPLQSLVRSLKEDLQQRTGTAAGTMQLQLYDTLDRLVAGSLEDDRQLGYYSQQKGEPYALYDIMCYNIYCTVL